MKSIKLYFTRSPNGVIGRENEILWYIHKENSEFREKTKDQIILMGKRAWEVIPSSNKPLNHCFTVIATRDETFTYFDERVNVIYDLDWYINNYINDPEETKELWIIGGSEILNQSIKYADSIEVIEVTSIIEGTIMAPKIDGRSFKLNVSSEVKIDQCSEIEYYNSIYKRISKSWITRGIKNKA